MTNLFICVPHGWHLENSYLLCSKLTTRLSSGKVLTSYQVQQRFTHTGGTYKPINTHKGCQYTAKELSLLKAA